MHNYFEEIKKSLKKLISIPSVEGKPDGDKPFGKDVYDALDYTLSLAQSLGFETVNYDNYIGEAVYGEGEDLAILVHLDVVPAGKLSEWKHPPFSATEENGRIYGRGAMDDKGPAITCLYAMKALKDQGFVPKKKIKLIFGCNEESGWKCIEHYKKVAKFPDYGFSPDADFPVLYAEKGILHVEFSFPVPEKIAFLKGGDRVNMVCDRVEAVAPFDRKAAEKYGVKTENGKLVTLGKSAHGSTPEKGVNALRPMLAYLEEAAGLPETARKYLFDDALSLKSLSDDTGRLTMSPDVAEIRDGKLFITVDFRYPSTADGQKILDTLKQISDYTVISHQLPLYNDKNGFLIQTLLSVYNETTGEHAEPIAIGGGTYARALKEGTAFGPQMAGEEETIHQPDEYVTEENLRLQFIMYKEAIRRLSE